MVFIRQLAHLTGHVRLQLETAWRARSLLCWRLKHSPLLCERFPSLYSNSFIYAPFVPLSYIYTSSPFLCTDYPLYFFCLQFTAQTVIFDNVARDRYLTKDFNNGLGNEVKPNWRSKNTDSSSKLYLDISTFQRFSRAGPRGRGREWATLGVHPLSWLLSNNRLEEVCGTITTGTFSSRLLLSNQDKGCTPSVAHALLLPLGPALLNLSNISCTLVA